VVCLRLGRPRTTAKSRFLLAETSPLQAGQQSRRFSNWLVVDQVAAQVASAASAAGGHKLDSDPQWVGLLQLLAQRCQLSL
jgi:hypothetical protein